MIKPNFFIVGAPKSGTTSMFYYLVQHPSIFNPVIKEPHYFSEDFPDLRVLKTPDEYQDLFVKASEREILMGESSVSYMYSKIAARRIKEMNPDSKIILMLRNPLEIIYSWHAHSVSILNENEHDFQKAWDLQDERAKGKNIPAKCIEPFFLQYREIGKLGKYLNQLREVFPSSQIKLIFYEDFKKSNQQTYNELISWLGATPYSGVQFRVMNASRINRSQLLAHITERHLGAGFTRRFAPLRKWLGLENVSLRGKLRRMNRVVTERPMLDPEFKFSLQRYFKEDVKLLSELSNRNLNHWLD
ncbi:MAG: sulfotransferase [Pseudomonadota bacterium]|nr:sulfotransferase [Pseudomonadota bacterium]